MRIGQVMPRYYNCEAGFAIGGHASPVRRMTGCRLPCSVPRRGSARPSEGETAVLPSQPTGGLDAAPPVQEVG
jgi:hypothetical protein